MRLNENFQENLKEYIKNNNNIFKITPKEINSSFFKNINNIVLDKKDKIKYLILYIISVNSQKNLKNIFLKWKYISKELNKNQNEMNLNFFDSCLSMNLKNSEINNKGIDNNIKDINKLNNLIISNFSPNKKSEIIKNNDNLNYNESIIINKDMKTPEKSLDFEENIYEKYNDKNNNSIIININNSNDKKNVSINENKNNNNNNINNCDNDIIDDYDIKINEEILNSKENLKLKSDIFSSNELNDSLNHNENGIINDNICNISTGKDIDNIVIKDNKNKNDSNTINISHEINEICNFSNNEKETINSNIKNVDEKKQNANQNNIQIEKIKDINMSKEEKNILINDKKNINNNNNIQIESIKNKNLKNNSLSNNLDFSIKNNNKDNLFDSLENNNCKNNNNNFHEKNKIENINNINMIQDKKLKIINKFINNDLTLENGITKKKSNTPKKYLLQISETNNIFLNNNNETNKINSHIKLDSFTCTNQTKVENIFIKGEKIIHNNSQNNIENKTKKNLELFIIDKNNDIFIKHNTNNNKRQRLINNYNYFIENNFIKNNIENRLIDSKMIISFLNNSKNEPMFHSNIFSTIQTSKSKYNLNNKKHNKKIFSSKTNKNNKNNKNNNIKNSVNFSTNNNSNYYEEYKSENINLNSFKKSYKGKKNHYYLKKSMTNLESNNKNNKKLRKYLSNLDINEGELIEPNIQKCPVTKSKINEIIDKKNINNICGKIINGNFVEDLLKNKRRKSTKFHKKFPKSLSSELLDNKNLNNFNTNIQNGNNINNKKSFISSDLNDFINNLRKNKDNKKRNSNCSSGEVYNYNTIKYDKYNTYREKFNKNNTINNKNSTINSITNKKTKHLIKNVSEKNIRKNSKIKCELVNSKKRNVDYKRLNELYLDYKIQDIKRKNLKKEQDIKRGITFIPHINKSKSNKYN